MSLECDDFAFRKVNWRLPLTTGGFQVNGQNAAKRDET